VNMMCHSYSSSKLSLFHFLHVCMRSRTHTIITSIFTVFVYFKYHHQQGVVTLPHSECDKYGSIRVLWISTLISLFKLHLVHPNDGFHSDFTTKILRAFLISHSTTDAANYTLLHLIDLIKFGRSWKLCKSLLCNFLYLPLLLSSIPNALLNTIVPSILSLCSCHNVRNYVSNPDERARKILITITKFQIIHCFERF
jgi:hypothetical protein